MIRIEFGYQVNTRRERKLLLDWRCTTCVVDDQGIDPDEGLDTVIWHLRRYHGKEELLRFGALLAKGAGATAKAAYPDDAEGNAQAGQVAESVAAYILDGPVKRTVAG